MVSKKVKVLIVDDSAFMRKSLSIMLESDDNIEVIDTARDGIEGYEKVRALRPNIITLDIEMPRQDGLTTLQQIMKDCPTPVLMISSLTTEGADATIKAMEYGAVDFIPKELSYVNVNILRIKQDLIAKVHEIVKQEERKKHLRRLQRLKKKMPSSFPQPAKINAKPNYPVHAFALGISTGGPLSLQKVVPALDFKTQPMFLVQHMPPKFTKSLADRLNSLARVDVKEAENGEEAKGGCIYIAPGGLHMTIQRINGVPRIKTSEKPDNYLHRPSVDVMLNSVVEGYGKNTMGIIMTGMGKDGLEGIKSMKKAGGFCIAQDEVTSTIYGMPKAVVDSGQADIIAPLEKIAGIINKYS